MERNELTHHGIKGMKWGVRRTPEQLGHKKVTKSRFSVWKTKLTGSKTSGNKLKTSSNSTQKKISIKKLTDDELKARIGRLEMEKRYRELVTAEAPKKEINRGRKVAGDIMEKSAVNIGTQLGSYLLGSAVNSIAGKEIVNPKKGQKDK